MSVIDDASLLKLAEAELLGEAKRATIRHSTAGPSGWQPVPKTNKTFLVNTLLQTLSSNRILARKHQRSKQNVQHKKRDRKLLQERKTGPSNNFVYKKPNKTDEISQTPESNSPKKSVNKEKGRRKSVKDETKNNVEFKS